MESPPDRAPTQQFIVRPAAPGTNLSILVVVGDAEIDLTCTPLDVIEVARALLVGVCQSIGPFDTSAADPDLPIEKHRPEVRVAIAGELLRGALADLRQPTTKGQTDA